MSTDNLVLLSLLLAVLLLYWDAKHGSSSQANEGPARWSLVSLLLASFLTLFGELTFIRWIAVEVPIFAYVKNTALLVCFLGFGIGCALAKRPPRWSLTALAILAQILMIRSPLVQHYLSYRSISEWLGAAYDTVIWESGFATTAAHFLWALIVCSVLLFLLALVFVPIGQAVSRQMDAASRPLQGYSWNLFGSLLGIVAFFLVCRQMFPPLLWFSIVFACLALLEKNWRQAVAIVLLGVPCILALRENPQHVFWTPYQQIETIDYFLPGGEWMQTLLQVNHTGYQNIVNLSPEFLARHPRLLQERVEDNPYNVPYRFVKPGPSVLIVGAGSGNDAAAALRNGSVSVDAVEIDPAIIAIGRRLHPEHPYDSPQVHIYTTDARAFLRRTRHKYDIVMFGLLDSHTQLSDYANMRIDNFVYTEEAIQEAKASLADHGVLFVKFAADRPWMGQRIANLITAAFGKPPLMFPAISSYASHAYCFAASPSNQVEAALSADPGLQNLARLPTPFTSATNEVPITTDDWPYLYQRDHAIPRTYYSVALIVIVLAVGFYWSVPEARRQAPSLFFFAMGAGFLLLETQVISRLALFFGTTWQVNGIVIGALLTTLLLANMVVEKFRIPNERILFSGLLGGLAVAYIVPFGRIPAASGAVGALAAVIFSVPVFFAGLIFATEFRRADSPSAALGANILGAVVGGLLENLSFVFGMRMLLVVAAFVYLIAFAGLRRKSMAELAPKV